MTDQRKDIRLADLRDAISLHGADISRWPETDRAEAYALSERSMTFKRLLDQEVRLESDIISADDIEAQNAHIRAASLAEHITAQARRIAQHAFDPDIAPDPSNFRHLSQEKKRGFRLLPKGFSDVAQRLKAACSGKVQESHLLLPPAISADSAEKPKNAQDDIPYQRLYPATQAYGIGRWGAGLACCFIAGWLLGHLSYTTLPTPSGLDIVREGRDTTILSHDDDLLF